MKDSMRILFTIPHYFGPGPSSYGSTDASKRKQRIASLRSCITSLHQHFGRSQKLLLDGGGEKPVNQAMWCDIDLVVCVTGENHILDELYLPPESFRTHMATVENPRLLGYSCYDVFRDACGNYDWYCFLEDDIIISDPLFFIKLGEFYRVVGDARCLLQPNRYELDSLYEFAKAYVDGPLWNDSAEFMAGLRLPGCRDEISVPFGSSVFRMTPAENTHSGCFFLTETHLKYMMEQPWYGRPVVGYADTLASAQNQYILALFNVFKPALECASFLEVHHHHQKYIGIQ